MIQALEFESGFFGFEVCRLSTSDLEGALAAFEERIKTAPPRLVEALCPLSRRDDIARLEDAGFRYADVRTTLSRPLAGDPAPRGEEGVAPAGEGDLAALSTIALEAYKLGRFLVGPYAPRGPALYAQWLRAAIRGEYDDVCLVSRGAGGEPLGFVTLKASPPAARVGLVGVAASARGQGLGKRLVLSAMAWAADRACKELEITTQGANLVAQSLYVGLGFRVVRQEMWLYWARMD